MIGVDWRSHARAVRLMQRQGVQKNGCRRKEEEYVRQDGERVRIKSAIFQKYKEPVS